MKRHLALIITSGPEYKSFIYSGLADSLKDHFQLSIFTPFAESLRNQQLLENVNIHSLPKIFEPKLLRLWRFRASSMHAFCINKMGVEKWHHYLTDNRESKKISMRRRFLRAIASPFWESTFSRIEKFLGSKFGTNPVWRQIFMEYKIDSILVSSYSNPTCLSALQTANNLRLSSWVITNSWKDVFVSPHLPLFPTDIFLWRPNEVDFLRKVNPTYPADRIHAIGSLHLMPFNTLKNLIPRDEFCASFDLDPKRSVINYTTAAPNAVRNEENIVSMLIHCIDELPLPIKPQLLIRTNPMETESRFDQFVSENVRIQKPEWEWLPEYGWNCPSKKDLAWWVSTVYYSAFNVSVSSSVTLEFACLGKPVINICFDLPDQLPQAESTRRFWDAPFYDEIRNEHMAIPVENTHQLSETLAGILLCENKKPDFPVWIHQNSIGAFITVVSKETTL